jgi:hypothetical protein
MKIRSGFVSNSSSSSFIVGFLKGQVPKSQEELQRMLFGDEEYVSAYDNQIIAAKAAERIFDDLVVQKKPMTAHQLIEALDGDEIGAPSHDAIMASMGLTREMIYDGQDTLLKERFWKQCANEDRKYRADFVFNLLQNHADKVFYIFQYADNSGEFEAVLEHGEVFARAPYHIRISHH